MINTQPKKKYSLNSQHSALMMKQFIDTQNDTKYIFVAMMNGDCQIVECKEQIKSYSNFKTKYATSCIYYDDSTKIIYLGDVTGGINVYSFADKLMYQQYFFNAKFIYEQRQKEVLIMIFLNEFNLYTVNLNNTLKVYKVPNMKQQSIVQFNQDVISSVIYQKFGTKLICLGFFNKKPPYVFFPSKGKYNFQSIKKILDNYYFENQQTQQQILQMCYDQVNQKLICSNTNHQISIYSIDEENINKQAYVVLTLCYRIHTEDNIMYINCDFGNLSILHQQKLKIIRINDKKMIISYHNKKFDKMRWGFIIKVERQLNNCIVSRGFNPFNSAKSKEGRQTLHILTLNEKE